MKKSVEDRFAEKFTVLENGCWQWNAFCNPGGYGMFYFAGKPCLAHRASYDMHYGITDPKVEIVHSCHNSKCVNPEHLRIDSHSNNCIDTVKNKKQRTQKITEEQVKEIRIKLKQGISQKKIADEYNLCQQNVSCIATKKSWWWLED